MTAWSTICDPASAHLLVGRATRGDKPLPNYFLLCREDPS